MTSIEILVALAIATWGGVELIKHIVPDAYQRHEHSIKTYAHQRLDDLEKKIEEITAKAKGAKK